METKDVYTVQVSKSILNDNKREFWQNIQSVSSAILYGVCSTSMAFTNKAVLTSYHFDFPFFIMASQMALCIMFLEFLRKTSITTIPKYTLQTGILFGWPSLFYAINSVTALYALKDMSIPMYAAVKRCAPIITLILSVIILRKKSPSLRIIFSVFLISTGCILASLGDLQFDTRAYAYGLLSIFVQGLYLTLSQRLLEDTTALHVLYICSCNTLPLYITACILKEIPGLIHYDKFLDFGFITCFGIQTSMGVMLNYSLFLCTAKNSALTTSLVGVLKGILQTAIGFFTFGGIKYNVLIVFGISLNLIGGIMYSYTKYTERHINIQNSIRPV